MAHEPLLCHSLDCQTSGDPCVHAGGLLFLPDAHEATRRKMPSDRCNALSSFVEVFDSNFEAALLLQRRPG